MDNLLHNTSSSIQENNRKTNPRYVISGGPGFGKTSIIEELERRNYLSIHEVSRSIIKEQMEHNGDVLPWKNLQAFSEKVFDQRVQQYLHAPANQHCFFDRSIIDVLAYMTKDKLTIPAHFTETIALHPYNQIVFLTPPWKEIYLNDGERKEDFDNANEIHRLLEQTYKQLGYVIENIPQLQVNHRVDFILDTINKNK